MKNILQYYLQDIAQCSQPISIDEEQKLATSYQTNKDQSAIEKLIQANLRLVIKIANNYHKNQNNQNIPLVDIIQGGNIGLMHAAKKYKPNTNAKFSTYAKWWIHRWIQETIRQNRTGIRLPKSILSKINKMIDIQEKLSTQLKRMPTNQEISDEMNIPIHYIDQWKNLFLTTPANLDHDNDDLHIIDIMQDHNSPCPIQHTELFLINEHLQQLMNKYLTPQEKDILCASFGINQTQQSFPEIALRYHFTRQRAQQIQQQAINKLQEIPEINHINPYNPIQQCA